jgi:pyruvate-formate lyase-activating enzyme
MTVGQVRDLLAQAEKLGSIEMIYFEGGEPFMYYATLLESIRQVKARGWRAGIVTSALLGLGSGGRPTCPAPLRGRRPR